MVPSDVEFNPVDDTALAIHDTVSNQRYVIATSESSSLESAPTDTFPAPVTDAVSLDVTEIRMSERYSVKVRNHAGEILNISGSDSGAQALEGGVHFLEIDAPVKTYLRVEGPFEYEYTPDELFVRCAQADRTVIGARAWQCYPQETITLTDSPHDLIEALSYFGDAVMTDSPERSFPTLRGYPPELRIGEALDVPSSLSKPEAGVTITVPPELSSILSVAPLAYYLLATVEAGEEFTIRTRQGFTYTPREDASTAVKSVLSKCFYLDCLVRTEGLYPFDLHERNEFEAATETDLAYETLYDQSLASRLETYLQVDSEAVDAVMPQWPLTAVVEPSPAAIEALPYLAPDLAHVRPADPPRYTGEEARRHALRSFVQGGKTRSTSLVFDNRAEFVDVPETESQQTVWVGDGIPLNATAFVVDGYRNQTLVTDRESSTPELAVTVVCNEPTMNQEQMDIQRVLDPRNDLPLTIETHHHVSARELRDIIADGADYLHFIGHATPDGLECADGSLDTATLETNNVELFFLNACQSFQQGKHLVETGSLGGIVTYGDVSDKYALETGGLICQLLNYGFPIGVCHSIVRRTTPIGGQYTVVGNQGAILAHPSDGPPHLRHVAESETGYTVTIETYTGGFSQYKVGSVVSYLIDPSNRLYLVPSTVEVDVAESELAEALSHSDTPVVVDETLQSKEDVL